MKEDIMRDVKHIQNRKSLFGATFPSAPAGCTVAVVRSLSTMFGIVQVTTKER